jgi:hypothetical protein
VRVLVCADSPAEWQGFQGLRGLRDTGKRQRGAHSIAPFLPLPEIMHELGDVPQWIEEYGVSEEMLDRMCMRCGVWVRSLFPGAGTRLGECGDVT